MVGVCRSCWTQLVDYAWHACLPGDIREGQITGPYCYECVPKAPAPWRHRIPRPGDEALSRLEAEARRHLGRRFGWVRMVDDPLTADRVLRIQGLAQPGQPLPMADVTAPGKAILIRATGPSEGPVRELVLPLATEPALVVAQVTVLLAPTEATTFIAR